MGWMFVPPTANSYVETQTLNGMVSGGRAFGRWLGHENGTLMNGISTLIIFLDFIYLFSERRAEREKEGVLWLGIEPAAFRFAGWHSIHWATPARTGLVPLRNTPESSLNL